MRLNQLDLNLFVVFDTIYAKRSLTRAAEVLCITQPAVSNALARLRKMFNDPLFVSTNKGMTPTPVAESVVGQVAEALRLLNLSVQEGQVFVPEKATKTFRLSMSDLAETLLLPALGKALATLAPAIRIESYYSPRQDLARELASGLVDLAIDAPLVNDPQLNHCALISSRYVCMLRRGHPLAGKPLSLDDYLSLGHIHVSSRRQGQGYVDAALNRLGCQRTIMMRVPHYTVAPEIVLQTDLALSAPLQLCADYDVSICELPFPLAPMELHMYWQRTADQDRANQWLRELLRRLSDEAELPPTPTAD
jgi:DNA-binding transcriptional LysR family regulator